MSGPGWGLWGAELLHNVDRQGALQTNKYLHANLLTIWDKHDMLAALHSIHGYASHTTMVVPRYRCTPTMLPWCIHLFATYVYCAMLAYAMHLTCSSTRLAKSSYVTSLGSARSSLARYILLAGR